VGGRAEDRRCEVTAPDVTAMEQIADRRRSITGLIELLGADELAALELCAHGLVRGRDVYGALDVATDTRDMKAEAIAELRDTMVYAAAGLLRLHRTADAMTAAQHWIEEGVRTWPFEKRHAWYIVERIAVGDDVYTREWDESDGVEFYQGKSEGGSPGFAEMRGTLKARGIELVYMGCRRWRAVEATP
jgi:hypothetical protein